MPTENQTPLRHPYAGDLAKLLETNPDITAAWVDHATKPTKLTLCASTAFVLRTLNSPRTLNHLAIQLQPHQTFRTLEAPLGPIDADNPHQSCQDEPIKLGTQIQPKGANWVGTAGAPVRWQDTFGDRHWGILSNWHVMAPAAIGAATTQHQPTDSSPAIAALSDAAEVSPTERNLVDAAIADAQVNGFHTISDVILGVGRVDREPLSAYVGLKAQKAGRTTQVTYATCTAIGAAVKIGYGSFTATFMDQDVYTSIDQPFSAAGDSGSLICTADDPAAVSLLFAGGGQLTIGNPMRHVVAHFNLQHPFN